MDEKIFYIDGNGRRQRYDTCARCKNEFQEGDEKFTTVSGCLVCGDCADQTV